MNGKQDQKGRHNGAGNKQETRKADEPKVQVPDPKAQVKEPEPKAEIKIENPEVQPPKGDTPPADPKVDEADPQEEKKQNIITSAIQQKNNQTMVNSMRTLVGALKPTSSREDILKTISDMANMAGLQIRTTGSANKNLNRKWETAQSFYDHMTHRTQQAIDHFKKTKNPKEAVRLLVQTREFNAETIDFTDKGRERLKGEMGRMHRKFAKDCNIEYDQLLKLINIETPEKEKTAATAGAK